MELIVRELLGDNFNIEDAILLREIIKEYKDENITLDFDGIESVPSTFFNCLFGEDLYKEERRNIFRRIDVKNLTNKKDYLRVVLGTAFVN